MDALDLLRSVSTVYSNLKSLEADGLLISHQEDDGFKQHSEHVVRVAYSRPNKIRIEQPHRNGQTIVSDGTHLYGYFRAPKRYFKSELQHLPGAFRPEFPYASDAVVLYERIPELVVSAELRGTGVIPVNGAETLCNVVSVTYEPPAHNALVKAISPVLFWFDLETNLVLRREVDITFDPPHGGGAHTVKQSMVLTRVATNATLPNATFEFSAPPDAEGELGPGGCGVSGGGGNRFKDPRHGIERQGSHAWEGPIYVERDKWNFKGHELAFERRWEILEDQKELAISERISGPKGDIDRSISIPLA